MKNLKLGLWCLLVAFAASIFLTSCEQEVDVTSETEFLESSNQDVASVMVLPKGYDQLPEKEIFDYITNLNNEDRIHLIENHRVASFLVKKNKLMKFDKFLEYGQTFNDLELDKILSVPEILELEDFKVQTEPSQIDSRGWWGGWSKQWEHSYWGCNGDYCDCSIAGWRRECHQWGPNYFEWVTVSPCSGAALPAGGWC